MSTGCPTSEGILEPANEDSTNPQTSEGTSFFAPNQWIELKEQLRKTYAPNCQFPYMFPSSHSYHSVDHHRSPSLPAYKGTKCPSSIHGAPQTALGCCAEPSTGFRLGSFDYVLWLPSSNVAWQWKIIHLYMISVSHILGCSIAMLNCQTGEIKRWVPVESLWLFLACGWYGALGRVANFEMCHLRSLGRVANFKNEACANGGIGFFWVFNMLHMLPYDHQGGGVGGWGACINVLDEHFLYVTEDAQVAHAVVWSSGGWGVGLGGVY